MGNANKPAPNHPWVTCPSCNVRIRLLAIVCVQAAGPLAQPATLAELAASEPKLWGDPGKGQRRGLVKECYKKDGPWVHFRVNGQDRLVYLKRNGIRIKVGEKKGQRLIVN